jgi:hypothetical protein
MSLGEFYIRGKIRYAIKANLIYYGTVLLIFVVLVIYVATKVQLNSSNFTVKKSLYIYKL